MTRVICSCNCTEQT